MILNKLNEQLANRKIFDPSNSEHLKLVRIFMQENAWKNTSAMGTCPFLLEWPYLSVPDMIKDKIVRNLLD
jgi:hypothetical protein